MIEPGREWMAAELADAAEAERRGVFERPGHPDERATEAAYAAGVRDVMRAIVAGSDAPMPARLQRIWDRFQANI